MIQICVKKPYRYGTILEAQILTFGMDLKPKNFSLDAPNGLGPRP